MLSPGLSSECKRFAYQGKKPTKEIDDEQPNEKETVDKKPKRTKTKPETTSDQEPSSDKKVQHFSEDDEVGHGGARHG